MENMFCFQCEQTAKGTGCTISGVCGKKPTTANLQDQLTGKIIALAKQAIPNPVIDRLIIDTLFTTVTNVNFNDETIEVLAKKIDEERAKFPTIKEPEMKNLWEESEDIRSLKSLILFGLRGMASYAHHAAVLGYTNKDVNSFFYKALSALDDDLGLDDLLSLTLETGTINLACMELLDQANTTTYGIPVPTKVSCNIEPGPFIVVTGHDLHDLKLLLEQTKDLGINIYTHGEMLPAHGYPLLKQYAHLKGNFGTAWQSQQKEFLDIPAPILFTTNCIMPVKDNYADRIFTTSVVSYPQMKHIDDSKDFTPLINKALELGGYPEKHLMTGINDGHTLTTGYGHGSILAAGEEIISSIKEGDIKHFFLVGGCDGAATGRNYYTEFVKQAPDNSIILTLACGKFRFNDLDLGSINGIPRILDLGQCNDAYGAVKVATTLASAFDCGVNDLPLTLVLSWYEQKAVCILLSLLALGLKNIYIGPSLPAFLSPNVLNIIVEKFNLTPISTPEEDLKKILS